jgi:hypothetical protein
VFDVSCYTPGSRCFQHVFFLVVHWQEEAVHGGGLGLVNRAPLSTLAAVEAAVGDVQVLPLDHLQAASQLWANSAGAA